MDSTGPTPAAIVSLTYIGRTTDHIREAEAALAEHVEYARDQGASWRMIGVALGVSAQAAWERYSPHAKQRRQEIEEPQLPLDTDGQG